MKNEQDLVDIWYTIEHANMCIMEIPWEEKKKRAEKIFEDIQPKTFCTWKTLHIKEAQQVSSKINAEIYLRHIIVILKTKNVDKNKTSKMAREKWVNT